MKQLILAVFVLLSMDLFSQDINLTSLAGVWRWQDTATDSEFEISIKKINFNWSQYLGGQLDSALVGGYKYKKNGVVLVDKLSEVSANKTDPAEFLIWIDASCLLNVSDCLTKNGKGEYKDFSDRSRIEIISLTPKQIRWIIEDNSERIVVGLSEEEVNSLVFPDGTALPTDIILTKIE